MAHWDSGRGPEAHRDVDVFWSDFLGAVPEIGDLRSAEVVALDDEAATAKLEAMRTYETQFPALNGGEADVLATPGIHRFELSWDLRAAGG
jgi:hypothetical protein